MKTAVILSDTHQNVRAIDKILPIMQENNYVFHLGDYEKDVYLYRKELSNKIISVKGNCDGGGDDKIVEIEGVKIFLTHGDRYNVKSSLFNLLLKAKEVEANVVFYGHTHVSSYETIDGITFINPGSMTAFGEKSYCYAVFHNGKVTAKIVNFE